MTKNKINNTSSDLLVSNLSLSGSTISTSSTNSDLILAPNGNGSLFSSNISFDSGVNTLNQFIDKIPFVTGITGQGGGSGETYTKNEGWYTVIGNQVFVSVCVIMSGLGTLTGRLAVIKPPGFENSYSQSHFYCVLENINFTNAFGLGIGGMLSMGTLNPVFQPSTNFNIQTITSTSLVNNLDIANLQIGSVIRGCASYVYQL